MSLFNPSAEQQQTCLLSSSGAISLRTNERFPHLQKITNKIPPLKGTANIHLLRGDAPELFKVQEFRNGPKGTPSAQKLSLGWTIFGQMCLDLIGGPTHMFIRRTNLLLASLTSPKRRMVQLQCYELIPRPNQLRVKDSFTKQDQGVESDIF